jgi:hypothetical protein
MKTPPSPEIVVDDFAPDPDLLQWVEQSQILLGNPGNHNPHALYFWGRYTESLMQRFADDEENLAFMDAHLEELREERRVA